MSNQNNQVAPPVEKNIVDSTMLKIQELQTSGNIRIPKDYSVENAMKGAFLQLKETVTRDKVPVLQACTPESISLALLKMAVQGLDPLKRQCSFIAYGNKLNMQREYQGSIALAKRYGVKSVKANAVFKGDTFVWEVNPDDGTKRVKEHTQTMESLGAEVIGAYCFVEYEDGRRDVEVMSMTQIRQSWGMGATKGNSDAHKNFPDQMAMKTVINRTLKTVINSSNDASLFDEDDSDNMSDPVGESVRTEVDQNANKKQPIGFDDPIPVQAKDLEPDPVTAAPF